MDQLYKHDCDRCEFLGSYKGKDLYVCGNNKVINTVVARHSSDPPDYSSGLEFSLRERYSDISIMTDCLIEAKERALNAGHSLPEWARIEVLMKKKIITKYPSNIEEMIKKWFQLVGYNNMNEEQIQEFIGDLVCIGCSEDLINSFQMNIKNVN